MSHTAVTWVPSDEDIAHMEAIRTALQEQGRALTADDAVIRHALRAAAATLRLPESLPVSPVSGQATPCADGPDVTAIPVANPAMPLTAHTDGACSGNPGPGGWAVVFSQGGKVVAERSGGVASTTNNRMELTAIREALRFAPAGQALEIATDSQNAIGWLSKGWKRNAPDIAALCRDIDPLLNTRPVTFRYVRGHNGDPFNERADRLAVAAVHGGG